MKVRTRIKYQIKIWEDPTFVKVRGVRADSFQTLTERFATLLNIQSSNTPNVQIPPQWKFYSSLSFLKKKIESTFAAFWLRSQKCYWNKYYCCQLQLGRWAKSNGECKIITSRNKCMSLSLFTLSCRRIEGNRWEKINREWIIDNIKTEINNR